MQPGLGIQSTGVDPNRNYGGFWGGPGASDVPADEDYRGPGPFSEPETRNIRHLVSHRQVTVLITNHTFSNLVLRPPGLASQPNPIDDAALTALGDAMAAENGYLSQRGYELYDTSGTTEDWSYNATGGYGYTFEIYCDHIPDPIDPRCGGNFHPTFPNVVDEYLGGPGSDAPPGGGGNREAYFLAMETAADADQHSVIRGQAPAGAVITLEKTFQTPTMNEPAFVEDHLETRMEVPASGNFTYHVNPSTRPLVAQATGREALGPPSGDVAVTPPSGAPNPATNVPCADDETRRSELLRRARLPDHQRGRRRTTTSPRLRSPGRRRPATGTSTSTATATTTATLSTRRMSTSPTPRRARPRASRPPSIEPEMGDGRLQPGQYVARVVNYAAIEPYDVTVTPRAPGTSRRPARRAGS